MPQQSIESKNQPNKHKQNSHKIPYISMWFINHKIIKRENEIQTTAAQAYLSSETPISDFTLTPICLWREKSWIMRLCLGLYIRNRHVSTVSMGLADIEGLILHKNWACSGLDYNLIDMPRWLCLSLCWQKGQFIHI